MEILNTARTILEESPLCDHCLGRQFATLLTGTTNDERGRALKTALGMQGHTEALEGDDDLLRAVARSGHDLANNVMKRRGGALDEETCSLCGGLFRHLDGWADLAASNLANYEFDTFLVGTKMPSDLTRKEEEFWTRHGAAHSEQLKSELNREVGRRLENRLDAVAELKAPDIVALLDPETQEVEIQSNPLYVYGRYRKLARGIPQTEWPCHVCNGRGCMRCDGTGYLYDESVEGFVAPTLVEAADGAEGVFHGCGREDIDALMLGTGRPFVLEVKEPRRRNLDLAALQNDINTSSNGKVEVELKGFVGSRAVEEIKTTRPDKTYRARIRGEFEKENLKDALKGIKGEIVQRTPTRVSHRRADRSRTRSVRNARLIRMDDGDAVVEVEGEAGLYIKELVNSDSGGTQPSITELVGTQVECVELDVLDVKYERETNGKEV